VLGYEFSFGERSRLVRPHPLGAEETKRITLEAFADTIIPGPKRGPDDVAIAGAGNGPGAVAAGALELLVEDATGIAHDLDVLVSLLNEHAHAYAGEHGLDLDEGLPPFVALGFTDRTALVTALSSPGHPEKEMWVLLALFCNMSFDVGAHMHTADAVAAGHPGLSALGIGPADADGLYRFPQFSYGRVLAKIHPDTDLATGSLR
jgi:hypothetical protein